MTYSEIQAYMTEAARLGNVMGFDGIRGLLDELANPQEAVPAIHIAGTNGKGSIMTYIEYALKETGLRVGRFISPAIFDLRDMWRIDTESISEERFCELMTRVIEADRTDKEYRHATVFELETALAFLLFREENCDIALVECGMGGRTDATNVIERSVLDIIASVSMDHMEVLGNTPSEIALEKLGIVRDSARLVAYPQTDDVTKVIVDYVNQHNVSFSSPDMSAVEILRADYSGSEFSYKGSSYEINIGGTYQVRNAVTAVEALHSYNEVCDAFGLTRVTEDCISRGFAAAVWPARFCVLRENPLFIADGAHNPDAWMGLAADIRKYFTNRRVIFIMGVLKDKQYMEMLRIMMPLSDYIYTVTPDSKRALDGQKLLRCIDEVKTGDTPGAEYAESIGAAAKRAVDRAGDDGVIIAMGSLSYMGELISEES